MTQLAILAAITAVVAFLPVRTLGLEITLSMVPVAVGAAVLGPSAGAFLGAVFGITSFLQCLGYSPFGAVLLGISPFLCILVCIPTRILAGYLAGVFYSLLSKSGHPKIGQLAACISAPVFNTLFFMTALVLCFYNTEYIQGFVTALGAANPFMFVVLFVGINGLVEIAAGIILAFPVTKALSVISRRSAA